MAAFRGHFHDGRTARRHQAEVRFGEHGLNIRIDGRPDPMIWPYRTLHLVSGRQSRQEVRLANRDAPDARLVIEAPEFLRLLELHALHLARRGPVSSARTLKITVLVVGLLAIVGGLVLALPRLAQPMARTIPLRWQVAWGAALTETFVAGHTPCSGPAGQRTLDDLTDRLMAGAGAPMPITVRVVRSPQVNAFALPGGQLVVLSGLIGSAKSADQVAGVLAHEIGHVVHRHPMEGLIRQLGAKLLFTLIGGNSGALVGDLVNLSYSRKDEGQADATAVRLLNAAGISADGLASFFQGIAARTPESVEKFTVFLSNHPTTKARAVTVHRLNRLANGAPALDQTAWKALRAICKPG